MSNSISPPAAPRTFLGHPLGLYILFFTEMWERFSYYGMRALLMLYMINYFKWSQQDASTVYKVYTSFVYVTPIIGGFLADRYLGNRIAVIIGAVLMAIGHFLMAYEEYNIFFAALIFLILGNGMFKPNMSTQVGRLYPANDGRRDAAYTIFYMGINLGAFLAPLACGWLADNTMGGYHSGFVLAGIGMVLSLIVYLLGQPLIKEIDPNQPALTPPTDTPITSLQTETPVGVRPLTEEEASREPSVLGSFNVMLAPLLYLLALGLIVVSPAYYFLQPEAARASAFWNALMLAIGGICLGLVGFICSDVKNGVRDRVLSILLLGIFVVFFWGAFEQAGNVLNIWADKNTNRYLWKDMAPPAIYPEVHENAAVSNAGAEATNPTTLERFSTMFTLKPSRNEKQQTWGEFFEGFFNPITTTSFQSINALAIFVIAPIFAWLWIWLDHRKMQPSIAFKMFLGLVFMAMSVAVMIEAARQEDRKTTTLHADAIPAAIAVEKGVIGLKGEQDHFEPFHAGRITIDNGVITVLGVLPDTERNRIVEQTAPASFKKKVEELAKVSKSIDGEQTKSVSVTLGEVPPGFEMKYAGLKNTEVAWDPATKVLTASQPLRDRETRGLLVAAGEPTFRKTMDRLHVESGAFRVSSWWLFWSYVLATLGELCLSPVGLSMVSKLAPVKYATMLMGVWLLTSAFGNFAAGAAGEAWGTVAPVTFFLYLTGIVAGAALLLLVLVPLLVRTMHGVK